MDRKDGGLNLSDLEKEIDSAVDNLLVKKKERTNPAVTSHGQPSKNHTPFERADRASPFSATQPQSQPSKVRRSFEDTDVVKSPSSSALPAPKTRLLPRELQEKLEEVEAQLLTLEWDLNAKHINNAITHLQGLRKYAHLGNELEKVIILIQRVLYQLMLDESKLAPAALKFLQKSWKAIKAMTDIRFSLEIDKETLVKDLLVEFQRLKIEEKVSKVSKEQTTVLDTRRPISEPMLLEEAGAVERSRPHERVSLSEIDKFMTSLEKLLHVLNEEQKRWESIHQEIINVKADLQAKLDFLQSTDQKSLGQENNRLDEVLERISVQPLNLESQQAISLPLITVSLFKVSGMLFALPEKQIIRSFPIKKWVSDSFMERGKVNLKTREIPLFNIFQVFKLKPSTEENPVVILIKGRGDHPAALIVDEAISREEIEYEPIEGRPYILGQGISIKGRVWILNVEQISP